VGAKKQVKAEAGAGATGIEPETAIQRDRSVTKHPHRLPLQPYNRIFVLVNRKQKLANFESLNQKNTIKA
jgi:hypothetical protein